jgi:hypothetical protein
LQSSTSARNLLGICNHRSLFAFIAINRRADSCG